MNMRTRHRAQARRRVKRTAYVLVILAGVSGCNGALDRDSSTTRTDSANAWSSAGVDTTPVAPPLAPEGALRAALDTLLRGPGPTDTAVTWFSPATEGALRSVHVDSLGHAIIDFEDLRTLIPNASSSAGSEMLLQELNATVFGVSAIRSVEYLIEGRCELFWEWLQRGCQTVYRPG